MSGLYGNVTGGFGMPKMVEVVDGNGNTLIGTVTDSAVVFDATREDVKVGKIFASNDGVQEGIDTKTYRTTQASRAILPGESFSIPLVSNDRYNYTKFQAMIAKFNITIDDSVSVNKIVFNDAVYDVNSTAKLSNVAKNTLTKSIDLNITNSTSDTYVIHYSTYKEELNMVERRYGFKYAVVRTNGLCVEVQDTTDYVLDPLYVPIENEHLPYLLKYYHPIPETVTSFSDFEGGKWYYDAEFTQEVPELNA